MSIIRIDAVQKDAASIIKWADDDDVVDIEAASSEVEKNDHQQDMESISSEEENGSEYDGEQNARTRNVQDIWDDKYIWNHLQMLPESDQIIELLKIHDAKNLLTKNPTTTLLLCTWLGKDNILKILLDNEAYSPQTTDEGGRSLLHLAACSGHIDSMKVLLSKGAQVDAWDSMHAATPLHCAASKGHLACVKLLIRHGADVNAGLTDKSPLYYAVQSLAVDCVKELLDNHATPNTPQVFSETPLHVAAGLRAIEIIRLLLKHGAAVNIQCGTDKLTPLHLAAEDGDVQCARLLIDAGAHLSSLNAKNQTPLHLAALSQCAETLELLLNAGADPNAIDKNGRTPLHSAIVKVSRSCDCVKLLLRAGAHVNQPDAFGYTALHLAALNEFSACVMILVQYGGDVTARTNGGCSVLSFITRKTPDVVPNYVAQFDAAIKLNDHELGDVDCELKLDFRVLVPARTGRTRETELLLNFIEVGHREILKHPLCETFLFLKWKRIRKFFLFSLFYHSFFVLLYSLYVVGVFIREENSTIIVPIIVIFIAGYFLLCFNVLLLGKEIFQIAHCWRTYIKQWENWLQWLIIISVFSCVHPTTNTMMKENENQKIFHHIAAIGIFLSWVELMMIVGRFPIFGLYIQMFTTVSINFAKFLAAYLCLLLAFALSFGVLFANYPSFKDLKWIVMKVIIMMSGELEFEDIFYGNVDIIYNWTAHIMFLSYVLLITIILTNLMVGLAVSDIQGLQRSAGLDRLVRQAELVAHLESMLFSRLLTSCVPPKLMQFFHKQALLLKSQYHWAIYIKPNDPREERIPKDLIRNIYKLVAERKDNRYYCYQSQQHQKHQSRRKNSSGGTMTKRNYNYLSNRLGFSFNIDKNQLGLKMQIDEINKELNEYCMGVQQKLDLISKQLMLTNQQASL